MDVETLDRLESLLVDSACIGMENSGDYLQLLFDGRRLIIESAWRLMQGGQIMIGSSSEDTALERLPKMIVGHKVTSVSVHGPLHDLKIEFDNFVIEVFADSAIYEHWKLIGGAQEMIVAGPGSLWSSF
jgi:hypothetical protein